MHAYMLQIISRNYNVFLIPTTPDQMLSDQLLLSGEAMAALKLEQPEYFG